MSAANPEYYEQIIGSLSSGVIAVDGADRVVLTNEAACEYLALSPSVLRAGAAFRSIAGVEAMVSAMDEVRADGAGVRRREVELDSESGPRILGMSASPLPGGDGGIGVIFLFTDLTEIRRLEAAAAINRQLAEIGELTAGVVHELRNPLSVISGMAELMIRTSADDERLRFKAETIFREAAHMGALVTQFLNFAKPFEIAYAACTPAQILSRTVELCRTIAEDADVELSVRPDSDGTEIVADVGATVQALGNLVRNAIEWSPRGAAVRLVAGVDGPDYLFRVEDEGPGIRLQPGEDLFRAFYTTRDGGTGLGLSMAHRAITAQGGTITHGNLEEGGAYFELRLPLTACAAGTPRGEG